MDVRGRMENYKCYAKISTATSVNVSIATTTAHIATRRENTVRLLLTISRHALKLKSPAPMLSVVQSVSEEILKNIVKHVLMRNYLASMQRLGVSRNGYEKRKMSMKVTTSFTFTLPWKPSFN